PLRPAPVLCCVAPATAQIHTLSLHDALPISAGRCLPAAIDEELSAVVHGVSGVWNRRPCSGARLADRGAAAGPAQGRTVLPMIRSEEHTSELQSRENLVCRLLLEQKN